jgi:hypothetical protein
MANRARRKENFALIRGLKTHHQGKLCALVDFAAFDST